MKAKILILMFFLVPFTAQADVDTKVAVLPCGIYDQQVRPFVEKMLETQSKDRSLFTMEAMTARGKRLTVEVQGVSIKMKGERNHVSVFLDGKPLAKTSHQDVPLYLEVHVDAEKYRIICVRTEEEPAVKKERETGQ